MTDKLYVNLWGKTVGVLIASKEGYKNRVCFYFEPDFLKLGLDVAPLRASIASVGVQKGLPVYPDCEKIFGGLPSFIADSLPDFWGNKVFSEWAKVNGIKQRNLTALDRLAYIGSRGMGALEFVPVMTDEFEKPFKVEIAMLSDLAQRVMTEAKSFRTSLSPTFAIESLFKVGTSAGGRRPKAVINLNVATGECYSGQVAPPDVKFTPMIVKFDEHSDVPSTPIEYSYYLMALAAELTMMPSRLYACGDEVHFLTERFDRIADDKIHVQTLAAMNPVSSSYEDLLETGCRLGLTPHEMRQLFLQAVMNILSGNIDDHNKNFSFTMGRDGVWHTAPAYDFTFSVDVTAPNYMNRHSMTLNGKADDVTREDFLTLAAQFNIKSPSAIIDKVVDVVSSYRTFATEARVPELWIERIEAEIAKRIEALQAE